MSSHKELFMNLTEEQYQTWRHHPLTDAFLKYLIDYSGAVKGELLQRWIEKRLQDQDMHEFRGIVATLEELSRLPLVSIKQFYGSLSVTTGMADDFNTKVS